MKVWGIECWVGYLQGGKACTGGKIDLLACNFGMYIWLNCHSYIYIYIRNLLSNKNMI